MKKADLTYDFDTHSLFWMRILVAIILVAGVGSVFYIVFRLENPPLSALSDNSSPGNNRDLLFSR